MFEEGLVVGKFAPLTLGHINLINIAATQCKHLTVILCFDEKFLSQQNERDRKVLTLKNRLRWLMQTYADIPHIDVVYIDESHLPPMPEGWKEYCDLLRQHIQPNKLTALFSSESGYDASYQEYLPEVSHVLVDPARTRVPISATMIRNNIYQYWQYLPSVVRQDYTIKVCVIGTESSGKTTLVKYLAKLLGTSWVEEYGRTYCEVDLVGCEALLNSADYATMAFRQKELEVQAMKTANKVTIIDTNAFVTEFYHRLYEGVPNPIVTAIAHEENYDLVLILYPTVPWVADGLRVNSDRSKTSDLFFAMLEEFPNQTPEGRTVNITEADYSVRLEKAVSAIEQYMHVVERGER